MAIRIGDVVKVKRGNKLARVCEITPLMTYKITYDGEKLVSEQEENLELAFGNAPSCPNE